jgi:NAD(P)-dependent dehydrogenase (short-subunit alcohol dehydrogenase family)
MRALKHDVSTLSIAISVVAPGITVTPILGQERKALTQTRNIEAWATSMQKVGVPINRPEAIALAVAGLMAGGLSRNGAGVMVQGGKMADVEAGIARSRGVWMGEEMLGLFRGGRGAPLFPNKL